MWKINTLFERHFRILCIYIQQRPLVSLAKKDSKLHNINITLSLNNILHIKHYWNYEISCEMRNQFIALLLHYIVRCFPIHFMCALKHRNQSPVQSSVLVSPEQTTISNILCSVIDGRSPRIGMSSNWTSLIFVIKNSNKLILRVSRAIVLLLTRLLLLHLIVLGMLVWPSRIASR